jgi:hypothetical protein
MHASNIYFYKSMTYGIIIVGYETNVNILDTRPPKGRSAQQGNGEQCVEIATKPNGRKKAGRNPLS